MQMTHSAFILVSLVFLDLFLSQLGYIFDDDKNLALLVFAYISTNSKQGRLRNKDRLRLHACIDNARYNAFATISIYVFRCDLDKM